ncbi:hypothetical protein ACYFX5_21690 [Bremerella sp. T1]|uniref:hypothetical protein n=1 Tax=Bremerella sp. TYQ1 TaxID=3119568 RepID=UPI001CCA4EB3|nr:hypothetical protein [Bremerella volcania]UBM35655.1 hypothetical protein LA756_23630 [Bremerella volcania]
MSHDIDAVVVAGDVDIERAREFEVLEFSCASGFTLIALGSNYVDAWADRLGIHGVVADEPLLNFSVVHHIVHEIARDTPFAILQTDYFGGQGYQVAAVYQGNKMLMAPERASIGPINKALKLLGVVCAVGKDEFESLGLERYRRWD